MVDVLLISPPPVYCDYVGDGNFRGMAPPLGLGYIAAVLEKEGYTVGLVDMKPELVRGGDLVGLLREWRPRVVGITTMVVNYKNGLRVADLVKGVLPETKVVVGGPHATFLVEETLSCPSVDFVVCYEGEETFVELMRYLDGDAISVENIRGIAFRDGDRVHRTEQRPPVADLDSLPLPARHLFKMELYSRPGTLITARGCPSQCIFCSAPALHPSSRYRERAPRLVVDEIEYMVREYGITSFFIADDTFTLKPERTLEICDLILSRDLRISWTCEARINTMTPALIEKLAQAGCVGVQYGVETGNPEIMRAIRKGIHLDQVEEVVHWTVSAGIDVVCSFIIGLPWDTEETVRQTIRFGYQLSKLGMLSKGRKKRIGRVAAAFTVLTPLPGSFVYEHAEELGIRFLTRDWDSYTLIEPVIETRALNAADIRRLYLEATGQWAVTYKI